MLVGSQNAGSAPAEVRSPEPTRLDLVDIYDIVIARRRLLIPAFAFSFALAFAYILFSPVSYTANLSILVDPRERVPVGLDVQPMPSNPDPALVESRMRELTSRAVLRRVVEDEHLLNDLDARPGILGLIRTTIGDLLRGRPLSNEERLYRAVESLSKEITAKRGERSYVVDVAVKGKTPEKAVQLGQALVTAYFANQSALSDQLVKKQTAWLDGRVDDMRARVEAAERRAQDYRDKEGIAETDGHTSPEQQLSQANAALVAARGRRAEVEARYAQLKAASAHAATSESVDDAIHSATIEKLRQDYAVAAREEADLRTALGPRHPSYIAARARLVSTRAQIADEFKRIVLATERESRSARDDEQSAAALVTKLEHSTNAVDDRRVELTQLDREATTLRATYEKVVMARENVRRDIVESPVSELLDPPMAGASRTSPKALPALLLALAAGINLWIASALILNLRERRRPKPAPGAEPAKENPPPSAEAAKPVEPNWVVTRLPPLKSAPFAVARPRREGSRGASADEIADSMRANGPFAEAVRGILAELHKYFGDSDGPSRLAIASARPGAGASTFALALAHATCDEGLRVLVADCHGVNSPLAAPSPGTGRGGPSPRRTDGARPRVDQRSGGEISYLPYPDRRGSAADLDTSTDFDLVILDCGSLAAASRLINRSKAADAVFVVDLEDPAPEPIASEIRAAGLAHCCVGVALTPSRGEARRKAS
jgi:uncharacterized protein involved in exopolysaccharide biosynthesis